MAILLWNSLAEISAWWGPTDIIMALYQYFIGPTGTSGCAALPLISEPKDHLCIVIEDHTVFICSVNVSDFVRRPVFLCFVRPPDVVVGGLRFYSDSSSSSTFFYIFYSLSTLRARCYYLQRTVLCSTVRLSCAVSRTTHHHLVIASTAPDQKYSYVCSVDLRCACNIWT